MQHGCITIQICENGRKSVSIEFPPQCPLFIVSNQSSFREWVVSNRMGVGGRLDNFSFDDGGKQGSEEDYSDDWLNWFPVLNLHFVQFTFYIH